MLALVLTGFIALVQSKRCWCGDGSSYFDTGSSNCWDGLLSVARVWNIKGSWEAACKKCAAKVAEHYYNDGPPESMNIFGHTASANGKERCWNCRHGTYKISVGEYTGSWKQDGEPGSMKCSTPAAAGGEKPSWVGRSLEMAPRRAVMSRGVEPSRSQHMDAVRKHCGSEAVCGLESALKQGYADSDECARDCVFRLM